MKIKWYKGPDTVDTDQLVEIENFTLDEDHGAYNQIARYTLYYDVIASTPTRFYRRRVCGYSSGRTESWAIGRLE